ncbi:Transposase [Nostoc flagelliforme CCNUN1]|uniref:Transposase n=1 Tax=Nostoc flagelliforme CCNUN1 TaxID=2038116 RepID=A0A2K8T265_9NOSO|nr:hypothetical protein [Nostoc flagelliforme]AUB41720.1 Transposase [Nostoc flagelliforme CCNUN1]
MLQPHRSRYWLNANPPDPKVFKQEVQQVCHLYQKAEELKLESVHVVSTDEMTGIQALERAYPTQEMELGKQNQFDIIASASGQTTQRSTVTTLAILLLLLSLLQAATNHFLQYLTYLYKNSYLNFLL